MSHSEVSKQLVLHTRRLTLLVGCVTFCLVVSACARYTGLVASIFARARGHVNPGLTQPFGSRLSLGKTARAKRTWKAALVKQPWRLPRKITGRSVLEPKWNKTNHMLMYQGLVNTHLNAYSENMISTHVLRVPHVILSICMASAIVV